MELWLQFVGLEPEPGLRAGDRGQVRTGWHSTWHGAILNMAWSNTQFGMEQYSIWHGVILNMAWSNAIWSDAIWKGSSRKKEKK